MLNFHRSMITIKCAVEAFHAALDSVAELPDANTEYKKVEGSTSKFQLPLLSSLFFLN